MHDLPFWMAGATNFSNQKFYYGASLASSSLLRVENKALI